jgi:hypothetical protein
MKVVALIYYEIGILNQRIGLYEKRNEELIPIKSIYSKIDDLKKELLICKEEFPSMTFLIINNIELSKEISKETNIPMEEMDQW